MTLNEFLNSWVFGVLTRLIPVDSQYSDQSIPAMGALLSRLKTVLQDPQIFLLLLFLVTGSLLVYLMGEILAPLFAAVILAYLLDGPVVWLQRWLGRTLAVSIIFAIFIASALLVTIALLPVLSNQTARIVSELPVMMNPIKNWLISLTGSYPDVFSEENTRRIIFSLDNELTKIGQSALAVSLASLRNVFSFFVYLILIPLLIFFFLKDKPLILNWLRRLVPQESDLSEQVWQTIDLRMGNYIRGKVYEIVIVWLVSSVTFLILGVKYSVPLGLLVGFSVLVPYVGALAAAAPVVLLGYFSFGFSGELVALAIAYLIIQFLDGNILAPLLLSEAVNLHPAAVVTSILIFGNLWGFWGIFFAIPLVTLLHAVLEGILQKADSLHILGKKTLKTDP